MRATMSSVFEMAIEKAVKEELLHFLYNDTDTSTTGQSTQGTTKVKRRRNKMTWMDFSDAELRIVDEVEKNPGMKQTAIVLLMSVHDEAYPDGTCEAGTVRVLLANLVKRKVLIASGTNGYTLNDSDYPPAKPYIRK
jgi:hypothetical protein